MAEGRQRHNWTLASNLMALLANINRAKNSRVFKPSDFDPFAISSKDEGVVITKDNIHLLRNAFLGDRL